MRWTRFQCAVETQRVLQVRNQSLAEQRRMLFRIGVHLGDVAVDGERIYGGRREHRCPARRVG